MRRKSAGTLLLPLALSLSLSMAGAVGVSGCSTSESRFESVPVQDFLVAEKELPQGFSSSPIRGNELSRATEGTQQPSRAECREPSKQWFSVASADNQAGEYLEYPAAEVVVALLLVRPAGSLTHIDRYIDLCQHYIRQGSGLTLGVSVKPYSVPDKTPGARAYQERIALSHSSAHGTVQDSTVSSTYLYGNVHGVGVIAILRSRKALPTAQQTASLNAIFAGQVEKISRTYG